MLTIIWLGVSLLGLVLIASAMDRFGGQFREVLLWYSQAMVPTLTLLLATFYATPSERRPQRVSPLIASVAMLSGAAYVLFASWALWHAFGGQTKGVLSALNNWSLVLAIVQVPLNAALVVAAVKRAP